jgi:UDP-GlcNAc:undecaprenyl-phosphate GlcNAc-1-phosphate transferase
MDLLLAFVIAMVITMALIPPLVKVASRLHVVDDPGARKVHDHPIPRVGGIAMVVGSMVPLAIWLAWDPVLIAYLAAVFVLLVFGAWDDRVNLGPFTKLAGQAIAVGIMMLAGHVAIDSIVLAERVELPVAISYALTFFFLLGVTNAINLSDGLDGLAGGTTLLCCAALTLLGQNWDVRFVETVGVVLMGAILGFLRFNTYPARVFMGDAGSQFLGFSIGVLSILLTKQAATPLSTALPLLLVGLPIIDTLAVMGMRLREGRSPFSADRKHFHHRLLALGVDHHEAVIVIYAVQAAMLLLAWQLRFESDLLIIAAFVAIAVLTFGTLVLLERSGWRLRTVDSARKRGVSPLSRFVEWLAADRRLPLWSVRIAWLSAAVYLLGVAALAGPVTDDIMWLSVAGLVSMALAAVWPARAFADNWLVRATLYVSVMVAVYLDHFSTITPASFEAVKYLFLPVLVVSVAISIRLSRQRRFEATPLDMLLIFAAIALPNLPGLVGTPSNFGISIAKLVALCYLVEMIAAMGARLRTALVAVVVGFNVLLVVRALV